MIRKSGRIVVLGDVNVWPHEYQTALALARSGYSVEFIRKSNIERQASADVYVDGERMEMKAPRGSKLSAVEDNLKKALRQSHSIIFDSRRMKKLPDKVIQRELSAQLRKSKKIHRIMFVNRHGQVIDID
jgi:hypothetical protein